MPTVCTFTIRSSIQSENRKAVAVNHGFDLIRLQSRKRCSFQHVIEFSDAGDGFVHRGERIIGAEENFVPYPIFLHEHQRVIKLKWSVMKGGDIGVNIGVLAKR